MNCQSESDTLDEMYSDSSSILVFERADDKCNRISLNIVSSQCCQVVRSTSYCEDLTKMTSSVFYIPDWKVITLPLLTAGTISCLGSLPYVSYLGYVDEKSWILFYLLRAGTYGFVFFSYWLWYLYNAPSGCSCSKGTCGPWLIFRQSVGVLFGALYSLFYSLKWTETDGIAIKYISVPCFVISWFLVFYCVMDKHLGSFFSSSGGPADSVSSRRRKTLLLSVKRLEKAIYKSDTRAIKIGKEILQTPCCSLLVARVPDSQFSNSEPEKLNVYEEETFDKYERLRANVTNIFLGFSLLLLTLAMLEDYGYYLGKLIKSNVPFLWSAGIFSFILACLYLLATYPIHHKATNPRWRGVVSLLFRLPLYGLSLSTATTRMNACYSIFGRIAARLQVPHGIGLPLIWAGIVLVLLIDYGACLKILSWSVKRMTSLVCYLLFCYTDLCRNDHKWTRCRAFACRYAIRYFSKKLKKEIRDCDDERLGLVFEAVIVK